MAAHIKATRALDLLFSTPHTRVNAASQSYQHPTANVDSEAGGEGKKKPRKRRAKDIQNCTELPDLGCLSMAGKRHLSRFLEPLGSPCLLDA